ncbi:MAG: alpha-glucoside transport system substrate-binding protein [Mycobacteriales bacterium]
MTISRRAVLAGAAGLAAAGCGAGNGTVRVYVIWSGEELAAFRAVMAKFSRQRGWRVELLTVGDDIDALLVGRVGRRIRPDVVLLSLSGVAIEHAADLDPVSEAVSGSRLRTFPRDWRTLVQVDGVDLGIWFKLAHKSLVWYRKDIFDAHGVQPPNDVAEWRGISRQLATEGVTPFAIGAADGWVLTDWFENLLLGLDPETYQRLARREPGQPPADHVADAVRLWRQPTVAEALRQFAGLISPTDVTLPGGARRALLMQFQDSVVDVFARGRAAMVAAADFATPVIEQHVADPHRVGVFRFPGFPNNPRPLVVGGDLAVLPKPASAGGRAVLEWLADPEAGRIWAARGGYISPLVGVDTADYSPRLQPFYLPRLLSDVRYPYGSPPLFDLSDQLTGALAGGDGRGSWRIMQEFFAAVGTGGDVEQAIQTTVDQFATAAATPVGGRPANSEPGPR